MNNTRIISPLPFFGDVTLFALIAKGHHVQFEQHENFQKRSCRNRNLILGSGGLINLSVPLMKGKNASQPITEVRISYDEDWATSHLESIRHCYENTAFYIYYIDAMKDIMLSRFNHLFELNLELMKLLYHVLELERPFIFTTEYNHEFVGIDLRKTDCTDTIIPVYPTAFHLSDSDRPRVSILNMLFNLGPETKFHLIGK